MQHFSRAITEIDQTNKTNDKLKALKNFFDEAADEDKLWALALFTHKRPRRPVNSRQLTTWALEEMNIPGWLFEESYQVVGDLSETLALLLPEPEQTSDQPLHYWIRFLQNLHDKPEEVKKQKIVEAWKQLNKKERFIFNKLLSGGWRVGVSHNLIIRALSMSTNIDPPVLSHKLMGNWSPDSISFEELIFKNRKDDVLSQPYPFYLAYQIENETPESLGKPDDWQAEWKWDGIRGQLICRGHAVYLWSRGEELINHSFPEFQELTNLLPDGTVLDGELLAFKNNQVQTFGVLQQRLGRKTVSKNMMSKVPVTFYAYDLLEYNGDDIRKKPLTERRRRLHDLLPVFEKTPLLFLSEALKFATWNELAALRAQSRSMSAEGVMIKKLDSEYKVGRKRGDWWKWKIDPLTIDAVMIYAQKGHGRRADLYTDYTFGVWHDGQLVTFTKAYSGLTDAELRQVDRFVKKNTLERFGPVRTVKPELVFEIAFEGIRESKRHKSGVALRFPRISRWRHDKTIEDANTLADLKEMLLKYG